MSNDTWDYPYFSINIKLYNNSTKEILPVNIENWYIVHWRKRYRCIYQICWWTDMWWHKFMDQNDETFNHFEQILELNSVKEANLLFAHLLPLHNGSKIITWRCRFEECNFIFSHIIHYRHFFISGWPRSVFKCFVPLTPIYTLMTG